MNVLIVDLGSKFNEFGGQARIAAILNKKLAKYYKTYYLGYRTAFTNGINNPLFLDRGKGGLAVRKSRISEMWAARFAYNLLVVHRMRDLDRKALLAQVRGIKPDIIIANSIQDINLVRFFKEKGLRFKSVYIDHGSVSTSIGAYFSKEGIPLTMGTGPDSFSLSEKKRKFFNFYDMNVALNDSQLQTMRSFTSKTRIIPNGMDVRVTRNRQEELKFRKKYGIKKGDFVVLYVGRMFDRQKNVSTLISAFKDIMDANLKLLLIGDGPSLNDYRALADGDVRIIFAGSLSDREINTTYNISSLFVLPSFWEGFSLTILEAAAHLLPLALSTNAYTTELKDRRIGRVMSFDPNDDRAIKQCIMNLYRDARLRNEAIAASKDIKAKFTEKSMIENYRKMIEELCITPT